MMRQALSLTRKELDSYFSSPMALIFVGVFLCITFFTFYWIDSFFARGIADVRALFEWMPILMIFLVAALTMRQWSEEQQTGTLQVLLTLPTRFIHLVLGKFLSVLALVIVALLLTLILPLTVSQTGNLDLGPVVGGYIASILMASAYIAIGLFVSSRTDNQIVALIMTAIVCGALYLIGSPTITDFFGVSMSEVLRAFGSGSRFESIERGVIDLRDLVYYLSLTIFFLALNVLSLDSKRWSTGQQLRNYRNNSLGMVALIGLNLVMLNVLLYPVTGLRLDLTENKDYSLSPVTHDILKTLQEPLLVRGYFSEDNHPLLSPLIPQVKDTLEEYVIASNGNMEVEFVDPISDPQIEREATQTYGIRPTPVQIQDRGGMSLKNVYFDLLVRYGDESVGLSFGDLIEVQNTGSGLDINLRNLEYDLTKSIQRVVSGFQSLDAVLASLEEPAQLTLYTSPNTLPDYLQETQDTMISVIAEMAAASDGKLVFEIVNVEAEDSPVDPQTLFDQYQIQPIPVGFFSTEAFYLHTLVDAGNTIQTIYPIGELSEAEVRNTIESALKRSAPGFLTTVGLWTPASPANPNQFQQQMPDLQQYSILTNTLRENYDVRTVDLSNGQVATDIDTLLVIAPHEMTDVERYAIDQYLMRGGSVMIAGGSYHLIANPSTGGLALESNTNGVGEMLTHYGINVGEELVLDTQNEPFLVPSMQQFGSFDLVDYPHLIDVRPDNSDVPITSDLPALTLAWSSPVTVDEEKNAARTVTPLFSSSGESWTTTSLAVDPNFNTTPVLGFPLEGEQQAHLLAVAVQGTFESFFKDSPSPFEIAEETGTEETVEQIGLIETSTSNAQLIVIGSAEFLNDTVLQLSSNITGDRYLNNLRLVQNSIDWFVEDNSLTSIRSGGAATRVLDPISEVEQTRWEILNYVFAIVSVVILGIIWRIRKQSERPLELIPPEDNAQPVDMKPAYQGDN